MKKKLRKGDVVYVEGFNWTLGIVKSVFKWKTMNCVRVEDEYDATITLVSNAIIKDHCIKIGTL